MARNRNDSRRKSPSNIGVRWGTAFAILAGVAMLVFQFTRNSLPSLPPMATGAGGSPALIDIQALSRFTGRHQLPDIADFNELSPRAAQDYYRALQAIEGDPNLAENFGQLGRVFQSHQRLEDALKCYKRASTLSSKDHQWHYYAGRLHAERYESEQAISALEQASQLNNRYAPTFLALGNLWLEEGSTEAARRAFERFTQLSPKSTHGYLGLAQIAFDSRRHKDAVPILQKGLALGPQDFRLHALLGRAYQQLGNTKQADKHFAVVKRLNSQSEITKRVLFDDPLHHKMLASNTTDGALNDRMQAALATGQTSIAIKIGKQLCSRAPSNAKRWHSLAAAHKEAKDYKQALAAAQRATQLDENFHEALTTQGQLLLILGKNEEALAVLDRVVEQRPDFYRGQYYRGAAQVLDRQYQAAVQSFRNAVRLQDSSARAHVALAEALAMTGETSAALQSYRRALEIDPTNQRARQAMDEQRQ